MTSRSACALSLLFLYACTQPYEPLDYTLSRPSALALVCQKAKGAAYMPVPLSECTGEASGRRLVAFITNGPTGDVAVMDLLTGDAVDTDPIAPETTRAFVGGYPLDLVSPPDSSAVWILDSVEPGVITMDPVSLEFSRFPLPWRGARMFHDAASAALLVTLPADAALARIELGEDGRPQAVSKHALPGTPYAIAAAGDGLALVSHQDRQFVSLLDLATLDEVARIGLVEPCRDGLDNDDDGLSDSQDPGCVSPLDFDEADDPAREPCGDAEVCPVRACANAADDDGDGLADLADPGCLDRDDSTEDTDAPQCRDGLDNDRDGKTDFGDDKDCSSSDYPFESEPAAADGWIPSCANGLDDDDDGKVDGQDDACLSAKAEETSLYPCRNGRDDDGDGAVDWPEDPDCFSAGSATEKGIPAPMAEIAVSPDGHWAYVAHRGLAAVVVLDLQERRLVDVNAADDTMARRLRHRRHVYGLDFPSMPAAIQIAERKDGLSAFVADEDGVLTRVAVESEDGALHQTAEAEVEEPAHSLATKPHMFVDGEEVEMGYQPLSGYPNLGPLMVETIDEETNRKRYYGISFNDDLRAHTNETWRVEYEGALPGLGDLRAVPVSSTRVLVPRSDLCAAGALPGYYLTLTPGEAGGCSEFVEGTEYSYVIAGVGRDWIEIEPGTGWSKSEEGVSEDAADPSPACFPSPVKFAVRPKDVFVLRGSRTGYLHNVVDDGDACVVPEGGEKLFTGLAAAARLKEGKTLPHCPVTDAGDYLELGPDGKPLFENPLFSLNIYPACRIDEEGLVEVVPPERGVAWTFTVLSGFPADVLQPAILPVDALVHAPQNALFLLDQAGRSLKMLDIEEFQLEASYY